MRIKYRFAFRQDDKKMQELFFGYIMPHKKDDIIVAAIIDENDERFKSIYVNAIKSIIPMVLTEFTNSELIKSKYLRILPAWHHQYPQPEDNFSYLEETFEYVCRECGFTKNQKYPFKIKSEPKWGNKKFMQLNWQFDSLFISKDIYEAFIKPYKIETIPVLHWKTGKELETVLQLAPQYAQTEDMVIDGMEKKKCKSCGKIRYLPYCKGFFPISDKLDGGPLYLTANRFGGGGLSNHGELLLRNDIFQKFNAAKFKGISYYATEIRLTTS